MQFEKLDKSKHDRKSFDCGVVDLNLYLQKIANQDQIIKCISNVFTQSVLCVGTPANNTLVAGTYFLDFKSVTS